MTSPDPAQQLTPSAVADIHRLADTDASQTAAHHTLGIAPTQATQGDHTHDGRNSKVLTDYAVVNHTHPAIPGTPSGTIIMYASGTIPTGWLLCDGQAVSRTTYATLFAAVGVAFGSGDGSTTFNVPNFAQRFPVGVSGSTPGMGSSGGAWNHGHANGAVAHNHTEVAHAHGVAGHTHSGASHSHTSLGHSHSVTAAISDPTHSHTVASHNHGHTHDYQRPSTGLVNATTLGGGVSETPGTTAVSTGVFVSSASTSTASGEGSSTVAGTTGTGFEGISNATPTINNTNVNDYGAANNPPFLGVNFLIKT